MSKHLPRWRRFPWSKYSADEFARARPLPLCPAARCRRAKQCLAAHKGLYCQRTHFTAAEGKARTPLSPTDKEIASIPRPPHSAPNDFHLDYIAEVSALRKSEIRDKIRLWKAGAFTDSHGPYRSGGIMKAPPPRVYHEE